MTLPLRDAVARVMAAASPLSVESVPLLEAIGRVAALPVTSHLTLPPAADAGMDGYAIRGESIATASADAPVKLKVLETLAAGSASARTVGPGEAVRIMTGAPVPAGADSVVRVEDTDAGEATVAVRSRRDAGRNIRPAGEDVRAGDVVIDRGMVIEPRHAGMVAASGNARVSVYRRPRVAILSSGDELVDVANHGRGAPGTRIIASNGLLLDALVREAGGVPVSLGIVPDERDAIRQRLFESPVEWDLLLTTGGVSVGAFDYTRDEVARAGVTEHFWRVRMRPGAQLAFGTRRDALWLGMPGNPVSAFVTFEIFARPVIRRMLGDPLPFRPCVHVRAGTPISVAGGASFFLRAELSRGVDGQPEATLTGPQGSNLQSSVARADALLHIPDGVRRIDAGEWLHALDLRTVGRGAAHFFA